MGSFEKLGILVIVVIIVMILAVAIYQWGGTAVEPDGAATLTIHDDYLPPENPRRPDHIAPTPAPPDEGGRVEPAGDTWPGGVPRRYRIKRGERVWNLVVKNWRLSESFIAAISAANPRLNVKRLRPGQELVIPDPTPYRTGRSPKSRRDDDTAARIYEIQEGDTLELIARRHLGRKRRYTEILDLNPNLNPRKLIPGKEIKIPVK